MDTSFLKIGPVVMKIKPIEFSVAYGTWTTNGSSRGKWSTYLSKIFIMLYTGWSCLYNYQKILSLTIDLLFLKIERRVLRTGHSWIPIFFNDLVWGIFWFFYVKCLKRLFHEQDLAFTYIKR